MFEVRRGRRSVFGKEINTWIREVVSCNILEVEVGTNGPHGGDSSSGCRSYLRIEDLGSTHVECVPLSGGGFELMMGGDTELDTLIDALNFAVKVLGDERKEASRYGRYQV